MDLRNMTAKEALRAAKELSGMTIDEITLKSGIKAGTLRHAMNESSEYSIAFQHIPALCNAMGNNILIQWFEAQLEEPDILEYEPAQSRADVLTALSRASADLGDVQRIAAENSVLFPHHARALRSGLNEVICQCKGAAAKLQYLASENAMACMPLASLKPRQEHSAPEQRHWWNLWGRKPKKNQ